MEKILRLLADPTRLRILLALEGEELAVNELVDVLGIAQSRISNHLRLLRDGGALVQRREGAWTFCRNALADAAPFRALWEAVAAPLRDEPGARDDLQRRRGVLERRRRRSRDHFAAAGSAARFRLGTIREEAVAAAAPRTLRVVDAGCGDGFLTEFLAERFDEVVAIDHSPERLEAARARLAGGRITWLRGELDALPLPSGRADALFLSLVLHHVPAIDAALREALRVLRAEGTLVVVDLLPHREESMREAMGDLRLGLEPKDLLAALARAGFSDARLLPARDSLVARGKKTLALFLAAAKKPPARTKKGRETR